MALPFQPSSAHLALAWLLALVAGVASTSADELTYRVSRAGREIGTYRFASRENGDGRDVEVEMSVDVKLLFLSVYQGKHTRQDTWVEGRLVRSTGRSVFQDQSSEFELSRAGTGYVLKADGAAREMEGTVVTFVPWRPTDATEVQMITEKGRTNRLVVEPLGRESIKFGGGIVDAERVRLKGRRTYELWYDVSGILLRATYDYRGKELLIERVPPTAGAGAGI